VKTVRTLGSNGHSGPPAQFEPPGYAIRLLRVVGLVPREKKKGERDETRTTTTIMTIREKVSCDTEESTVPQSASRG